MEKLSYGTEGPVVLTLNPVYLTFFFSQNSVFLSQYFSQNSIFQPISAKIQPAERGLIRIRIIYES